MNEAMRESILQEPIPPESYECCDSGCGESCVFEIYFAQKRAYDAQKAKLQSQNPPKTQDTTDTP